MGLPRYGRPMNLRCLRCMSPPEIVEHRDMVATEQIKACPPYADQGVAWDRGISGTGMLSFFSMGMIRLTLPAMLNL